MKFLWLLIPLIGFSSESFISDYEYGEMLYDNPRGVGCKQCHGNNGEGKNIVKYRDKKGEHIIMGADIRKKSLVAMIRSVNKRHKVMPRYYLTDDEVKQIFNYLKVKNKRRK